MVGWCAHSVRVLMFGSQLAAFSERDHLVESLILTSETFVLCLSLFLVAVAGAPRSACGSIL